MGYLQAQCLQGQKPVKKPPGAWGGGGGGRSETAWTQLPQRHLFLMNPINYSISNGGGGFGSQWKGVPFHLETLRGDLDL